MALKAQYPTQDEIPEAIRGEYKQDGDVYKLEIVADSGEPLGFVPFTSFKRELDKANKATEKLKPFAGIKLEDLQRKAKAYDELGGDDNKSIIESKVATATKEVVEDRDRLAKENEGFKSRLSTAIVDSKLATAAATLKVRPEAVDDFIRSGREVFKVGDDDKPVAYDGETIINGKDGKPMSIEEWGGKLKKTKAFLFLPSVGGGAHNEGGGAANNGGRKNPWNPKTWDITEQALTISRGRAEAKVLAAEYGVNLDDPSIMAPTTADYEKRGIDVKALTGAAA